MQLKKESVNGVVDEPSIVSVIAGPPHPIKAASLNHALKHLGIHHVILDLGYYSSKAGINLYRSLHLPDPTIRLALRIIYRNDAAADVDYEAAIIEHALAALRPNAIVVYGDLPGSVAAAVAAQRLNLRIIHAEAGRRSGDKNDGEEFNRVALATIAHIHLAPSSAAKDNLIDEGIALGSIRTIGNLAIETLFAVINELGHLVRDRKVKWSWPFIVTS